MGVWEWELEWLLEWECVGGVENETEWGIDTVPDPEPDPETDLDTDRGTVEGVWEGVAETEIEVEIEEIDELNSLSDLYFATAGVACCLPSASLWELCTNCSNPTPTGDCSYASCTYRGEKMNNMKLIK